ANIVGKYEPEQYGIDLIFFDLEDLGDYGDRDSWCKGSKYFVQHFLGTEPEKVIIVDMVGDKDLNIEMEYFSYHNSPRLVNEIWQIAEDLGYSEFQPTIGQVVYDDHYPFIQKGYNAMVIIDFDYPWWHTLEDTPDKCSPYSLQKVGEVLLNLIYDGRK
ncbi:MAG: M28 family peptidase, partial [Candidatus Cloacimonadota bacterium]|nr:M28 family peptidase [Candidatus Cloacimonadota bacterium]